MTNPIIALHDGQPMTTSLDVAEKFGKLHLHVLRDIRRILEVAPKGFTESNFGFSDYLDPTGRTLPMYRITRDGFALLAMGFTGAEALAWKIRYIEAFNQLEQQTRRQAMIIADLRSSLNERLLTEIFRLRPLWPRLRYLLAATTLPIRQIATLCGYRSPASVRRNARRMEKLGLLWRDGNRWAIPGGQPRTLGLNSPAEAFRPLIPTTA